MRDDPIGHRAELTSLRRFTWWSVTSMTTTVMVVVVAVGLLGTPTAPDPSTLFGVAALAVAVLASITLLARRLEETGSSGSATTPPGLRRWHLAGNGAAVVLGVLLLAGDQELWAFAPATTVALSVTFLPTRRAWTLVAAAALLLAGVGAAVAPTAGHGPVPAAALPAGLVVSVAALTLGLLWSWDVAERLDEARRLSAEIAVKDERLRFAAELHDVQGHHLQVIALKSELASRLLASDPERAARELEDVQSLAAEALQDTRAVVQGYRRTTLLDELANATKVLSAAGIHATTDVDLAAMADAPELPDVAQRLLGLVVREATTNILRHSHATRTEITYRATEGSTHLTVSNDGASAGTRRPAGSGLVMLAERLEAAGGALAIEDRAGRFVLDASLPLTATMPSELA